MVLCIPYTLGALLYLLLRNYLRYNVNEKAHRAFAPLTFEEMFASLIIGSIGGDCGRMESLEIEMDKKATALPTSRSESNHFNRFHAMLGFSPEDFDTNEEDINMEFPLSDKKYAKLTLDQAYSERTQKKRKGGEQSETLKAATTMLGISEMRRRGERKSKVLGIDYDEDSEDDDFEWYEGRGQEDLFRELPHAMNAGREAIQKNVGEAVGDAVNVLRAAGEGMKTAVTQQPSFGSSPKPSHKKKATKPNDVSSTKKKASSPTVGSTDIGESISTEDSSEIPSKERIPEQDADVTDGRKKPLKEDMVDIHGKLMMNTFHVFDDRVYITRNEAGKPVKSATSPTNATIDASMSKKDAEMRRMIGLTGSSNPVTARLSDYMNPILSILQLQNQLARTVYNIWTWQDPFASFWATWLLLIGIVISVTFPFRLFAFVAGIIFVGPQNLLIRILRERRGNQTKGKVESENPNDVKALVLDEVKEDNIGATTPQFSVCNHLHLAKGQLPKQRVPKDDFELVVPYSPFRKQRFYDWPPDRSVSRVTFLTTGNQPFR